MSMDTSITDIQRSTSTVSNNSSQRRRSVFFEDNAKLIPELEVKDVRIKNSDGDSNEGTETEIKRRVVQGALARFNTFNFFFSCAALFIVTTLVITGILQKVFKDENMGIFRACIGVAFGLLWFLPDLINSCHKSEKPTSDNLNNDMKDLPLFIKSGDKFIDYQRKLHRLGMQKDLETISSDPISRVENFRRMSLAESIHSQSSNENQRAKQLQRIRRASLRRASLPSAVLNNISISSVLDDVEKS